MSEAEKCQKLKKATYIDKKELPLKVSKTSFWRINIIIYLPLPTLSSIY